MRLFTAAIERCADTGLCVGFVPGFPGAHSQAATLDELNDNLHEIIHMLMEDGDPVLELVEITCWGGDHNKTPKRGPSALIESLTK